MSNLSAATQSPAPPLPQSSKPTPPRRQYSWSSTPLNPLSVVRQGPKSPAPPGRSPAPFGLRLNSNSNDPLLQPPRRTHLLVWCSAFMCLMFCLLIIFLGITTLILFLVIRPKYPSIDVINASLNAIYFDSPENFNGDFTLVANFTNANRKIYIRYDYLDVGLYFVDRLIATQASEPFSQKPGEGRMEIIHLISSLVYLPPNPAIELQRQVQNNRVDYIIRGAFRVRARVGVARFSYWLHTTCHLQMTSPPRGFLVTRNCTTRRK